MEARPELATWLGDRKRQAQSRADADGVVARWLDHPLYRELETSLAAVNARAVPQIMAAAERFMDRLADINGLLAEFIALAAVDPYAAPPLVPVVTEINTGYLLFAHQKVTIGIGVISADALAAKRLNASGPTAIPFTGAITSYRFLKSGGATVSFWEAPLTGSDFSVETASICRLVGRRTIADGEAVVMDGRCQSLVIEHLAADMLCLQATVQAEAAPLSVNYDSRTLRYMGATSTDEASSRTQIMVTLLRMMERADALPVIEQALDSPHFYTRWHVMREMLALDAEVALPSLRRMARSDPHPEVRFAATQALSLFFEDEEEEALLCRA